jgi:hypothetical protein
MELSESHDPGYEFNGLIRINSGYIFYFLKKIFILQW